MPRAAKILSARAVSELRWKKTSVDKQGNPIPTPYPVGGAVGLYLTVTKDLGRSCITVTQVLKATVNEIRWA